MVSGIRKAWAAWLRFGKNVANYVGIALFAILYVVVFAPVAIIMKLRSRKFLPQFCGNEPSYFLLKEPIEPTLESMRRQG